MVDQILDLDARLLVSAERLRGYIRSGQEVSAYVQRGVINRQLDQRLDLMRERDEAVAS